MIKLYDKILKSILKGLNEAGIFDDDLLDNDELTLDELNVADNIYHMSDDLLKLLKSLYGCHQNNIPTYFEQKHLDNEDIITMRRNNPVNIFVWTFIINNNENIYIFKNYMNSYGVSISKSPLHVVKKRHIPFQDIDKCIKWFKKYVLNK